MEQGLRGGGGKGMAARGRLQCWCPGNSCPPTGALSGPKAGSGVFSVKTPVAHCK